MSRAGGWVVAAAIGMCVLAVGCSNGQAFTTARTIEPETAQHSLGLEIFIRRDPRCGTSTGGVTTPECANYPIPWPSYVLRQGIAPALDYGLRFAVSGALGADLKLQFLRTQPIDLAIDPGITLSGANIAFNMQLLVSINLGSAITLTLAPRGSYLWPVLGSFVGAEDGALIGAGANVQFRLSPILALMPTFQWERRIYSPTGGVPYDFFTIGFAISFGGMPLFEMETPPTQTNIEPPPEPAGPASETQLEGDGFIDNVGPPNP